ncbi:MAG: hypothetical protein HC840_26540 [Leptolyngbyaceae cyanobacterium RM2_2_4]|nr:hypothetical protein [Leptolyngbyaceae cyanobacterium SM1_4_3]NJN91701.1 hypothetical protein [Leptolyngbyaceae cyanobacterium SL_5_14]NJO52363.1 hypothetical protein [Leptolyngbyaceae cyanobacterium RM2_2_4]
MNRKPNRNHFPLWSYLNQPLFNAQTPLILRPQRFWYSHNIRHLERCWHSAYRPEEHFRS